MNRATTSTIRLTALMLCGLAMAGCARTTPGQPSSDFSSSTPSTGATAPSLATANPCSLLDPTQLPELGLPTAGKPEQLGTGRHCQWGGTQGTIGVTIRTNVGLDGVPANLGPITDITVGSHPAKQQPHTASGGCLLALEVSPSARVDVNTIVDDTTQACPVALRVARLVEPHLPSAS